MTAYSLQRLPASRAGATPGVRPPELFPPARLSAGWRPDPRAVHDIAIFCSEDQKVTMPRSFRALIPAGIRTSPGPKSGESRCSPGIFRCPKDEAPKPGRSREPKPGKPQATSRRRVAHRQDLSSTSPENSDVLSERVFPTGSELTVIPQPKSRSNCPLHTTISKRSLKRAGPCGAVPGSFPRPPRISIRMNNRSSRRFFVHKSLNGSMLAISGKPVETPSSCKSRTCAGARPEGRMNCGSGPCAKRKGRGNRSLRGILGARAARKKKCDFQVIHNRGKGGSAALPTAAKVVYLVGF